MLMSRTRLLLATLWAGSLWSIGYLAAPTLFATLSDKMLAGSIAGSLFRIQAWLSIFCAIMLIGLLRWSKRDIAGSEFKILLGIILGMLGCALVLHFGLHPLIAGLRNASDSNGLMPAEIKRQFGILHGLSSGIYLVESLLAVVLIVKIR
jgi:hypothetical protein